MATARLASNIMNANETGRRHGADNDIILCVDGFHDQAFFTIGDSCRCDPQYVVTYKE
jgi:hypothetical protein